MKPVCTCAEFKKRKVAKSPLGLDVPLIVFLWQFPLDALKRLKKAIRDDTCFLTPAAWCPRHEKGGPSWAMLPDDIRAKALEIGRQGGNWNAHDWTSKLLGRELLFPELAGVSAVQSWARLKRMEIRNALDLVIGHKSDAFLRGEPGNVLDVVTLYRQEINARVGVALRPIPAAFLEAALSLDRLPTRAGAGHGVDPLVVCLPPEFRAPVLEGRLMTGVAWLALKVEIDARFYGFPSEWREVVHLTDADRCAAFYKAELKRRPQPKRRDGFALI